jgi:hypothetical protein
VRARAIDPIEAFAAWAVDEREALKDAKPRMR